MRIEDVRRRAYCPIGDQRRVQAINAILRRLAVSAIDRFPAYNNKVVLKIGLKGGAPCRCDGTAFAHISF
jgi:hypothetical protein